MTSGGNSSAAARQAATSAQQNAARQSNWQTDPGVVEFGGAQARDRTQHQRSSHSAADCRLRQRYVDCGEPDPGNGQQQSIDDERDNGFKRLAGKDRRSADRQDQ